MVRFLKGNVPKRPPVTVSSSEVDAVGDRQTLINAIRHGMIPADKVSLILALCNPNIHLKSDLSPREISSAEKNIKVHLQLDLPPNEISSVGTLAKMLTSNEQVDAMVRILKCSAPQGCSPNSTSSRDKTGSVEADQSRTVGCGGDQQKLIDAILEGLIPTDKSNVVLSPCNPSCHQRSDLSAKESSNEGTEPTSCGRESFAKLFPSNEQVNSMVRLFACHVPQVCSCDTTSTGTKAGCIEVDRSRIIGCGGDYQKLIDAIRDGLIPADKVDLTFSLCGPNIHQRSDLSAKESSNEGKELNFHVKETLADFLTSNEHVNGMVRFLKGSLPQGFSTGSTFDKFRIGPIGFDPCRVLGDGEARQRLIAALQGGSIPADKVDVILSLCNPNIHERSELSQNKNSDVAAKLNTERNGSRSEKMIDEEVPVKSSGIESSGKGHESVTPSAKAKSSNETAKNEELVNCKVSNDSSMPSEEGREERHYVHRFLEKSGKTGIKQVHKSGMTTATDDEIELKLTLMLSQDALSEAEAGSNSQVASELKNEVGGATVEGLELNLEQFIADYPEEQMVNLRSQLNVQARGKIPNDGCGQVLSNDDTSGLDKSHHSEKSGAKATVHSRPGTPTYFSHKSKDERGVKSLTKAACDSSAAGKLRRKRPTSRRRTNSQSRANETTHSNVITSVGSDSSVSHSSKSSKGEMPTHRGGPIEEQGDKLSKERSLMADQAAELEILEQMQFERNDVNSPKIWKLANLSCKANPSIATGCGTPTNQKFGKGLKEEARTVEETMCKPDKSEIRRFPWFRASKHGQKSKAGGPLQEVPSTSSSSDQSHENPRGESSANVEEQRASMEAIATTAVHNQEQENLEVKENPSSSDEEAEKLESIMSGEIQAESQCATFWCKGEDKFSRSVDLRVDSLLGKSESVEEKSFVSSIAESKFSQFSTAKCVPTVPSTLELGNATIFVEDLCGGMNVAQELLYTKLQSKSISIQAPLPKNSRSEARRKASTISIFSALQGSDSQSTRNSSRCSEDDSSHSKESEALRFNTFLNRVLGYDEEAEIEMTLSDMSDMPIPRKRFLNKRLFH